MMMCCKRCKPPLRDGTWGKYQGGHVEELTRQVAELITASSLSCPATAARLQSSWRCVGWESSRAKKSILAAYDYPGNFLAVHSPSMRLPVAGRLLRHTTGTLAVEAYRSRPVSPATRAVIVSHLHGGLVPMRELMGRFAATHGSCRH